MFVSVNGLFLFRRDSNVQELNNAYTRWRISKYRQIIILRISARGSDP